MKETQSISPKQQRPNQPGYFIRRIGNTTFRVGVHFSGISTETAQDKITRLIRHEAKAVNQ